MCRLFPLESKELALSLGGRQKKTLKFLQIHPTLKEEKYPQVGSSS